MQRTGDGVKRAIVAEPSVVRGLLARSLDFVTIVLTGLAGWWLETGSTGWLEGDFLRAGLIGLLLTSICFAHWAVYRSWRGTPQRSELEAVLGAWLLALLLLMAILELTGDPDEYGRHWLLYWTLFGAAGLAGWRVLMRRAQRYAHTGGRDVRRVVLVTNGGFGLQIIEQLATARGAGFEFVGWFDERDGDDGRLSAAVVQRCLGPTERLAGFVEDGNADEVWIALPFRAETRLRSILWSLRHCTADIRLVPDISSFRLLNHSLGEVAGLPVINLSSTPMSGRNRLLKAIEDRTLAGVCLILAAPLLLVIALGVYLTTPGPLFFRPVRLGYDGRPFRAWKFRCAVPYAGRNRFTRFGVFLRHTGLEGLPQLLNVLDGSMAIVGPCPHAAARNAQYKIRVDGYMRRFKVKPGLTGWSQIHVRDQRIESVGDMERRLALDLEYIENWSLELDLRIVLLTVWQMAGRVFGGLRKAAAQQIRH